MTKFLSRLLLSICGLAQAGKVAPRVIAWRALPLLFADDSGRVTSAGITRTMHPTRTRSAPMMVVDHPREAMFPVPI